MHAGPKYQQVARDLLQAIDRVGVGDALPAEVQLCAHDGVSRITVRAAISTQVFDAAKLTAQQARWLQAARGDAALRVQRWHQDARGETLIHSINTYPNDRYSDRMRMQRTMQEGEAG